MAKTISEQLRDYFKMVPPSAEKIAEVRQNWRKPRQTRMIVDIASDDSDVAEVLAGHAKNDNKIEGQKQ